MNKKGAAELSMSTIIIAIIAIIFLLLIVTFFTGGLSTVFGKIREVFRGGTAGYDIDLAKTQCQDYCRRAEDLGQTGNDAVYCRQEFNIAGADGKTIPTNCWESPIKVDCSIRSTCATTFTRTP